MIKENRNNTIYFIEGDRNLRGKQINPLKIARQKIA